MPDRSVFDIAAPSLWFSSLARLAREATPLIADGAGEARITRQEFRGMPGSFRPRPSGPLVVLRAAWRRRQTRRCLAELDAHALKDIGVTYSEAEAEANKPFWMA